MMSERESGSKTLRLRDGRLLGYGDWGDPAGAPVLYFHGLHSSRLALYQSPAFFAAHGVRFITVDRPGIGLSTYQPRRTPLDWPADVAQLADALGLARFGALSIIGGAMYALACAARMPERLTSAACVSPAAPLDAPGVTFPPGMTGRLLALARRAPWALWAFYAVVVPYMRADPKRMDRLFTSGLSEPDLRVMKRPEVRQMQAAMLLEVFRPGYRGEVQEMVIAARPWGFPLAEISIPVQLWSGDQNALVPPGYMGYLASAIPTAQAHMLTGAGGYLLVDHMEEILQPLIGR